MVIAARSAQTVDAGSSKDFAERTSAKSFELPASTDALSKSVFVLGPVEGLKLIDRLPGVDAIVIDAEGVMRYSAELSQLPH